MNSVIKIENSEVGHITETIDGLRINNRDDLNLIFAATQQFISCSACRCSIVNPTGGFNGELFCGWSCFLTSVAHRPVKLTDRQIRNADTIVQYNPGQTVGLEFKERNRRFGLSLVRMFPVLQERTGAQPANPAAAMGGHQNFPGRRGFHVPPQAGLEQLNLAPVLNVQQPPQYGYNYNNPRAGY